MTRILLVVPPVVYARQPSIGVAYLSAYLKSAGHEIRVMDLNTRIHGINDGDDAMWGLDRNAYSFIEREKEEISLWIEEMLDYDPDIIGFNVWSTSKRQALYMAEEIKKVSPEKLIVFGGPETVLADNLLKGYPQVDILVRGEGEEAMAEIAEEFSKKKKVESCRGCFVRKDGEMVLSPVRDEIQDINTLPFPDYSDFHMDK